jgi:hypothetical protein
MSFLLPLICDMTYCFNRPWLFNTHSLYSYNYYTLNYYNSFHLTMHDSLLISILTASCRLLIPVNSNVLIKSKNTIMSFLLPLIGDTTYLFNRLWLPNTHSLFI